MEPIPKAEFSIVTRNTSKAWIPELIAAAGPEVTETYIDFSLPRSGIGAPFASNTSKAQLLC